MAAVKVKGVEEVVQFSLEWREGVINPRIHFWDPLKRKYILDAMLFPCIEKCACYQHVCAQMKSDSARAKAEIQKYLATTPLKPLVSQQTYTPSREQWDNLVRSEDLTELRARQDLCDKILALEDFTAFKDAVGTDIERDPLKLLVEVVVKLRKARPELKPATAAVTSTDHAAINTLVVQWITEMKAALPFILLGCTKLTNTDEVSPDNVPIVEVFENKKQVLELGGTDVLSWAQTSNEWLEHIKRSVHTRPCDKFAHNVKTETDVADTRVDDATLVGILDQIKGGVKWIGHIDENTLSSVDLTAPELKFVAFECGHASAVVPIAEVEKRVGELLETWRASQKQILDIDEKTHPASSITSPSFTSKLLAKLARNQTWFQLRQDVVLGMSTLSSVDGSVCMPHTQKASFKDRMFGKLGSRGGGTRGNFLVLVDAKHADVDPFFQKTFKLANETALMQSLGTYGAKHAALRTCVNSVGCFGQAATVLPVFSTPPSLVSPPNASLRRAALEGCPTSVIVQGDGVVWEQTSAAQTTDIWNNPSNGWMVWTLDSGGSTRVPFKEFVSGVWGQAPVEGMDTIAFQTVMTPESISNGLKILHAHPGFKCVVPCPPLGGNHTTAKQDETDLNLNLDNSTASTVFELGQWPLPEYEAGTTKILSSRSSVPVKTPESELMEGEIVLVGKRASSVSVSSANGVSGATDKDKDKWPWIYSFGTNLFPKFKPKVFMAAVAPANWPKINANANAGATTSTPAFARAEQRMLTFLDRKSVFGQTPQFVWDMRPHVTPEFWTQLRILQGMPVACCKHRDIELSQHIVCKPHRMSPWVQLDTPPVLHSGNWKQVLLEGIAKTGEGAAAATKHAHMVLAVVEEEGSAAQENVVMFFDQGVVVSDPGHVFATVTKDVHWESTHPEDCYPMDNGVLLDLRREQTQPVQSLPNLSQRVVHRLKPARHPQLKIVSRSMASVGSEVFIDDRRRRMLESTKLAVGDTTTFEFETLPSLTTFMVANFFK